MMQTDYRLMMAIRADDMRDGQEQSTSRARRERAGWVFASRGKNQRRSVRRYLPYAAAASIIVAVAGAVVS